MLYRPVAGFASSSGNTGSVTALPCPCCSQDSLRPLPVFWKHDHGGRQRSPSIRRLGGLQEIPSAVPRAGRRLTELSSEGSCRLPPWSPEHGGSLDFRAVAVATESSLILSAWDLRSSPPVLLETGGVRRENPSLYLDVEDRSVATGWTELDKSRTPGKGKQTARDTPCDENAVLMDLGGAAEATFRAGEAIDGVEKSTIAIPEKPSSPKKVHANKGKMPWNKGKRHSPDTIARIRQRTMEAVCNRVLSRHIATPEQPSPLEKVHANKGKMPWNKGKRHSPETIARIRQRTIEAMCNPVIREKLRKSAISQSDETKAKKRAAIAANWNAKRLVRKSQAACVSEWKELVAEGARIGGLGDTELQWDSYRIILRELILEEKQRKKVSKNVVQRKETEPSQKRIAAADHRSTGKKLSEAIRAKWSDSDSRARVSEGVHKFTREETGVPARPPRKRVTSLPSVAGAPKDPRTACKPPNTVKKQAQRLSSSPPVKRLPVEEPPRLATFVDPRANERLERIKRIQAERRMMELKKLEASERARLLMAKAEKAMKALEAVAVTDEGARVSLAVARNLLAEAADKMRSAESRR